MLEQQMQQLFHGVHAQQGVYLMAVRHGYQPMHPPRKEVSLQKMHEILARHVAKKEQLAQPQAIVQTPKAEPLPKLPKITWQKPHRNPDGTGYILSEGLKVVDDKIQGEGWIVSKAFVGKLARYSAFRIRPEWRYGLGCKDTAEEAKALCEAAA